MEESLKHRLGRNLRALRIARGLTQEKLAEQLNVTPRYLAGIERGERNLTLDSIESLVAQLEVATPVVGRDRGELALEDRDQEVAGPARRLQEAGVDPLRLGTDQIEHRVHEVGRGEHLAVVGNPLLGLHQ